MATEDQPYEFSLCFLCFLVAEWFGHGDDDSSRTRERRAAVSDQHVVNHEDVACLPSESHSRLFVSVVNCLECRRIDWRAVSERGIDVEWVFVILGN